MNPFRHFGRTPWTGDRPIALYLHGTGQHKETHIYIYIYTYTHTHTHTPPAEFEPTITMFEQSKIVGALDANATGIGW
jgi:hypothetical protein